MSMKFTRKGFFKSIFGGVLTAVVAPSILKAEEKPQPIQEFHPLKLNAEGSIGLGTSCPNIPLVVSSLIFQVGERQILMSGDEKGDFQIKWLDVKENECAPILKIQQPNIDKWNTQTVIR